MNKVGTLWQFFRDYACSYRSLFQVNILVVVISGIAGRHAAESVVALSGKCGRHGAEFTNMVDSRFSAP